jgi:hypothetical protein
LIGLTIVGVVVLLYLLYKRGRASGGGGGGAVDTSSMPTIISTGGGGIQLPANFGGGAAQTYDATIPGYPAANANQVAPNLTPNTTMQVMPGTSASGVPAHTAQAQEFATAAPIATPSAATSAPSYYQSAQDLVYQNVNTQYAPDTATTPSGFHEVQATLESFLQGDVRQYEFNANQNLSNPGVPNQPSITSSADLSSILGGEASQFCAINPAACKGADQASLIQQMTNAYSDFVGSAAAKYNQPVPGTVTQGSAVPNTSTTVTPSGTAVTSIDPKTGLPVKIGVTI